MACVAVCPKKAIVVNESPEYYNAEINTELCVNCNACHRVCQVNNSPGLTEPKQWLQGWSADSAQRKNCASGGAAYEIEKAFLSGNGHVWTCRFNNGGFYIEEVNGAGSLREFANSKYVKSNPIKAYREIRTQLKTDRVLFVGLPCQVAGLKNFIGANNRDNLYTVDLICHGSPSPKLLETFLNQYKASLSTASDISFRAKTGSGIRFEVKADSKPFATAGTCDCYTMGFLEGLTYTENCYSCPYASTKRVSDLTLGDSWGSELEQAQIKSGISLFIIQTDKGRELVERAALETCGVDIEKAIANNSQLTTPMNLPENRVRFFAMLKKHSFNYSISRCLPKFWVKQKIKAALIRTRLIRP